MQKSLSSCDILKIRQDFPMLQKTMHGHPLIYFDTAATALKPVQVIDAIDDYYRNRYGTVHRAVYELSLYATQEYQDIRIHIQQFLGAAHPEEIIFTRGTTASINLVAYSFGKAFVKPGDEIIISEMEHHSNIVPWQILCEDRGAILHVVRINDRAEIDLTHFDELLNSKTKLVAVAHIANSTGTVNPIKTIIERAHHFGAKVLIDGAQSAPHQTVNMQELDADFYVFSGHKLYGPTGIGVLYGKAALLNAMPPYQGGGDMIESVYFEKTTYNTLPLKFEAGTPMIAEVIGLGAAITYVEEIGLHAIHDYEQQLLAYATKKLSEIKNLRLVGKAPEKGAITSFVVEGAHPLDIATLLDLKGIALRTGHLCAQPTMRHFNTTSLCRASYAFYNTFEEIDYFIQSLKEVLKRIV